MSISFFDLQGPTRKNKTVTEYPLANAWKSTSVCPHLMIEVHKILAKGMYDMAKPSKDPGEEYFLRPGVVCHYLLQVSQILS